MSIPDNLLLLDLARFLYSLYEYSNKEFENIRTVSNVLTAVANIYIDQQNMFAEKKQSKSNKIFTLCEDTIDFFAREETKKIKPIITLVKPYFDYLNTRSKQQTQKKLKQETTETIIEFLVQIYEKYKDDYEINNLSSFIASIVTMCVELKHDDNKNMDTTSKFLNQLVKKMVEYLNNKPIYFLYAIQMIAPSSLDLLSNLKKKEESYRNME